MNLLLSLLPLGLSPVPDPTAPLPSTPGNVPAEAVDGTSSLLSSGTIVFVIIVIITIYLVRQTKKNSAERAIKSYEPLSKSLYTTDAGKVQVFPGWYPTPAGTQDRYHDGIAWTEHYREHTDEGKLGDEPPEGVTPVKPEPINDPWPEAQNSPMGPDPYQSDSMDSDPLKKK